jgi:DNA gyrase/topoisomerase IV subunit A
LRAANELIRAVRRTSVWVRVWDLYHQKFTAKVGNVVIIQLIDNTTEMMVISQFGKIIRIDTKSVRAVGRSNSGVKASIT